MRVEIVAVGTELLLGQIADTNSAWMGEQLAAAGVTSHFHQAVGDNHERIVLALRTALARSDGVIACGGLGPTQDDITRDAIAAVMNVPLERDPVIEARIAGFFRDRGRTMSANNARQADVPRGARAMDVQPGTAPGLVCPVGNKVIYAVPGVPYEMQELVTTGILPDLRRRMAERGEEAVISSRVLRTWGASESGLAEVLGGRIEALDLPVSEGSVPEGAGSGGDAPGGVPGSVTIAFLASGMEGIKVRLTARAGNPEATTALLDDEEEQVRGAILAALGDIVFGLDDETMEHAVAGALVDRGLTLGLAESLTGGLVASRLVEIPGASAWFRGSVVSYASDVKRSVLGVPDGPVVSQAAASAMATGARDVLGSDVALSLTGVAGPEEQDGVAVGTVFAGLALGDEAPVVRRLHLPGDRTRVRQYAAISGLDLLRRALRGEDVSAAPGGLGRATR